MKYTTVEISGIIMQVALKTDIKGYTEGVIEAFLPESGLSEKEERAWIIKNNKRMKAICKFLNENNL
jgi:hypothetical protein